MADYADYTPTETLLSHDPYDTLDVSKDADDNEIKSKYRKLAIKYHPDKVDDEGKKDDYTKQFHKVQEAYDRIGNAEGRDKYKKLQVFEAWKDKRRKAQESVTSERAPPPRSYSYNSRSEASRSRGQQDFADVVLEALRKNRAMKEAVEAARRHSNDNPRERVSRSTTYDSSDRFGDSRGSQNPRRTYTDSHYSPPRRAESYKTETKYSSLEESAKGYQKQNSATYSRSTSFHGSLPTREPPNDGYARRSRASPRDRDRENDYDYDKDYERDRKDRDRAAEERLRDRERAREREKPRSRDIEREAERLRERERERPRMDRYDSSRGDDESPRNRRTRTSVRPDLKSSHSNLESSSPYVPRLDRSQTFQGSRGSQLKESRTYTRSPPRYSSSYSSGYSDDDAEHDYGTSSKYRSKGSYGPTIIRETRRRHVSTY